MRRREFLFGSTAGLLAARMSGHAGSAPKTTQPTLGAAETGIFPIPFSASMREGRFVLADDVVIVTPADGSNDELAAAKALRDELADWFGLILTIRSDSALPRGKRAIVIGTSEHPSIRNAVGHAGTQRLESSSLPEAYTLRIGSDVAVISGVDSRGVRYGLQSFKQLIDFDGGRLGVPCVDVVDHPQKSFRGVKLYLPGPKNIPFFKRFIRDFVVAHKYNTLIMELNAGMRLESHPEMNAGWREMLLDTNYSRRNYPPGSLHGREQNSCHQDTADGDFLEKQELAELADFIRSQGIELIPELPSFTHSYYLLTRHKELSEVGDRWPDTYCPSNPKTYELLFEVYDEYIDLLKPKTLHVGHDELFAPVGLCPKCGDRDIGERYGEDVARIRSYLQKRNIGMAMWGDMLMESVRGKGLRAKRAPDGWNYKVAGALTREQVERLIPKDILIFNWFWAGAEGEWSEEQAEKNEEILEGMGFKQIYGNFNPSIENYSARSARRTILGGAPSAWFATNESNFGRTMIADIMGCSNILWHGDVINGRRLSDIAQARMPLFRSRFRGELPPSSTESAFSPIDISSRFNVAGHAGLIECDLDSIQQQTIYLGTVPFRIGRLTEKAAIAVATVGSTPTSLPSSVDGIRIDSDFSSLLFLHACAKPAANREPDRLLWDVFDSADVLGWYEARYEDGYTETIPIRYGVNIAEWDWQSRKSDREYCYGADPILVSGEGADSITMFAYEWSNPRPGKVVAELRLNGTRRFRGADSDYTDHYGSVIADNAIMLVAVSIVNSRESGR